MGKFPCHIRIAGLHYNYTETPLLIRCNLCICNQPRDFQAYGGTWGKMSFLHFHGYWYCIDTKHPAKLFCLILPNKGIMAIFVIFEISKFNFLLSKLIKYSLIHWLRNITILRKFLNFKHFSCNLASIFCKKIYILLA